MSEPKIRLVTLGGECFEVEPRGSQVHFARDGVFYFFYITNLKSNRGKRLVSLVGPSDSPGLEKARLNAIREALDSGTFSFEDPHDDINFKELPVLVPNIETPREKASEEEIRQLIMNEAYWLSWKHGRREPVQFDSPVNLDYLRVDATIVGQNQWFLEQEGLLEESAIPGMGRPTKELIKLFESRQSTQTATDWVFPPKTPYDGFKVVTGILRPAQKEILIADNYVNTEVLDMLAAIPARPPIKILTHKPSADFKVAISRFASQHGGSIEVRLHGAQIHDRTIVIDDTHCYALGASIKDLGKSLSLVNKVEDSDAIAKLRSALSAIWVSGLDIMRTQQTGTAKNSVRQSEPTGLKISLQEQRRRDFVSAEVRKLGEVDRKILRRLHDHGKAHRFALSEHYNQLAVNNFIAKTMATGLISYDNHYMTIKPELASALEFVLSEEYDKDPKD